MSKKKKPKKKKLNRQKNLPSYDPKIVDKVKRNPLFSDKKIEVFEDPTIKMSEIILEFAKPLMEKCHTDEQSKKSIALSIMVWNICLLPKGKQIKEKKRILNVLSKNDLEFKNFFDDVISFMMQRKEKYFSEYRRFIADYMITDRNNKLHLSVAFSPSNIDL